MWRTLIKVLTLLATIHSGICQDASASLDTIEKCFPDNLLLMPDVQDSIQLSKYEQEFTLSLVKKTYSSQPGTNIFFSPHSIYQALLLSLFVSSNHTEYNIKRALHLPPDISKPQVIQAFKLEQEFQKMRTINSSSSYEFNSANRLFVNSKLNIRDCMKQLFQDEIFPVDYASNPDQALDFINQWVSTVTKNQIKDLLSNGDVSDDTKLILVNAAYFKGLWQSKFLPENTRKDVFFISPSKNGLVPMMRQKGNFKYYSLFNIIMPHQKNIKPAHFKNSAHWPRRNRYREPIITTISGWQDRAVSEKLRAHILQLPYKGNDISMFIILPPFLLPGLEFVINKLTGDILQELVEPGFMSERPVEIYIPKFTVEQQIKLVPVLESVGVGDLFQKTADLSALTGNDEIKFNDAIHKARVSIDEDGTVASAATAIYTFRSSRPLEPIKFICNHPFLYFIYDHLSQSILFIGVYNTPL